MAWIRLRRVLSGLKRAASAVPPHAFSASQATLASLSHPPDPRRASDPRVARGARRRAGLTAYYEKNQIIEIRVWIVRGGGVTGLEKIKVVRRGSYDKTCHML
jgi:hypothetical protein